VRFSGRTGTKLHREAEEDQTPRYRVGVDGKLWWRVGRRLLGLLLFIDIDVT